MRRTVIGLTGLKGSGKTTLGSYLTAQKGFVSLSFAAPLKRMIDLVLELQQVPYTDRQALIYGDKKEEPTPWLANKTARHAMQTLGTEWGRDCIGPDFWVNVWRARADEILANGRNIVVDDLRFPNEFDMVSSMGTVFRIFRPKIAQSAHISERHVDSFWPVKEIANDGTINELIAEFNKVSARV